MTRSDVPKDYYSLTQVAARFTVSVQTIYEVIKHGALQVEYIGGRTLVSKAELARFTRDQKAKQKARTGVIYDRTGAAHDLDQV